MNKPWNHSHLEEKELEQIPSAEKMQFWIQHVATFICPVCITVTCEINYVNHYMSIADEIIITMQIKKKKKKESMLQ